VKKQLWGGEFWGKGYFVNTVGEHSIEKIIANYLKSQGIEKNIEILKK
jgi:putative transposase